MGVERLPHGEVWLIRHAETEWSVDGRHTGRTDIPLTADGRAAAAALAPRLARRDFALVLTSPLSRASETAKLAGMGGGAIASDDLIEWDYGEYEGITSAEIHTERPDWSLWRDGCPGGESPQQVGVRADRVIDAACEAQGDVALFAHGHVLRVLGARWIGLEPAAGARLALRTGTISVLGTEHDVRVIKSWGA
jgi:probable phosphoglycerate mutase